MIGSTDVAQRVERNRDEIAWRIITNGVLETQRTLAVSIIADEFVERLLVTLERGSYLDLVTWVDQICASYPSFPYIGSMLAGACRSVIAQLGGHDAVAPDVIIGLSALEHSISAVAFKPRQRFEQGGPVLDEADTTIQTLVERLAACDPLSAEHARAVSAWCGRIARRLSLGTAEVQYLERCGLVLDVGKIAISPDLLCAARPLTEAEWTLMRSHPCLGEEIVAGSRSLRNLAPTVRSHHERLDGRGYPDGLSGSQLTLATRIATVADSFNAMIGRRAYRPPISPENALDRLIDGRGSQFDPIVVEALVSVVRGSSDGSARDGR